MQVGDRYIGNIFKQKNLLETTFNTNELEIPVHERIYDFDGIKRLKIPQLSLGNIVFENSEQLANFLNSSITQDLLKAYLEHGHFSKVAEFALACAEETHDGGNFQDVSIWNRSLGQFNRKENSSQNQLSLTMKTIVDSQNQDATNVTNKTKLAQEVVEIRGKCSSNFATSIDKLEEMAIKRAKKVCQDKGIKFQTENVVFLVGAVHGTGNSKVNLANKQFYENLQVLRKDKGYQFYAVEVSEGFNEIFKEGGGLNFAKLFQKNQDTVAKIEKDLQRICHENANISPKEVESFKKQGLSFMARLQSGNNGDWNEGIDKAHKLEFDVIATDTSDEMHLRMQSYSIFLIGLLLEVNKEIGNIARATKIYGKEKTAKLISAKHKQLKDYQELCMFLSNTTNEIIKRRDVALADNFEKAALKGKVVFSGGPKHVARENQANYKSAAQILLEKGIPVVSVMSEFEGMTGKVDNFIKELGDTLRSNLTKLDESYPNNSLTKGYNESLLEIEEIKILNSKAIDLIKPNHKSSPLESPVVLMANEPEIKDVLWADDSKLNNKENGAITYGSGFDAVIITPNLERYQPTPSPFMNRINPKVLEALQKSSKK